MEQNKSKNQEIKGYKILGKIAVGGMGEVFKAMHPILNKEVILKKLLPKAPDTFFERFKREAMLMMEVSHPNIAHIFDYFKENQASYIVMEYIPGYNLSELIKKFEKLPVYLASYIACEIAKGLSYAHGKNIIHRDIKPGNVLISLQGEIKLTDFGIAFKDSKGDLEDDITKSGTLLGTPAYMSPEQIYSSKDVDKRTDIYSLGVLFYEMLTGARPYKNDFTMDNILKIRKGKYTSIKNYNKNVPDSLIKIVKKMLSPRKEKRYRSIDEFINEINPFIMHKFKNQNFLKRSFFRLITRENPDKELEYFKYPDIYIILPPILRVCIISFLLIFIVFESIRIFPQFFINIFSLDRFGILNIRLESYSDLINPSIEIYSAYDFKLKYKARSDTDSKNIHKENIVLPSGKYYSYFNNNGLIYPKEFIVYPFKDKKDTNLLSYNLGVEKSGLCKLNETVIDSFSGKRVFDYKIFYKKIVKNEWKELLHETMIISNETYDFSILKKDYNISVIKNVFIPPNQNYLNLEFVLTKRLVRITLLSEYRDDIKIKINDAEKGYIDLDGVILEKYDLEMPFYINSGSVKFNFLSEKNNINYETKRELSLDKNYMIRLIHNDEKTYIKVEIEE